MIASFHALPTLVGIVLLMLAAATAAGIGAVVMLEEGAGYFECPYCKTLFVSDVDREKKPSAE